MKRAKRIVLQVGESTHTHILESQEGFDYEPIGTNAVRMVIDKQGVLRHEEHGKMVFNKGNYFKFPQVEYDPMKQTIREVFD